MIHGLRPGPLLFTQNPEFVWALIASMYIGNIALLIMNMPMVPLFTSILQDCPTRCCCRSSSSSP